MKQLRASLRRHNLAALLVGLIVAGCASDGYDGSSSASVHVGYSAGYYDPYWYGGYPPGYYPPVIIDGPDRPNGPIEHPSHPIARPGDPDSTVPTPSNRAAKTAPARPSSYNRPTSRPSPRPAMRPMPRGGGGRRR